MENDQGHLRKPECCHCCCGDSNRPGQFALAIGYPGKECQTGESANQQTGRIDEVRPEVENFGSPDYCIVQNILDVSKVSTRAEMDQNDSEYCKRDERSLCDLSVLAF